jgi:site-specific recombinase XerD
MEISELLTHSDSIPVSARSPLRASTTRLAIILLYTTGLRRGELLGLNRADYHPLEQKLTIQTSKFHKSRILPLPSDVALEVEAFLEKYKSVYPRLPNNSPLMFNPYCGGRAYSSTQLRKNLHVLFNLAGIRKADSRFPRIHDFRFSFAVNALLRWYRDGDYLEYEEIQEILSAIDQNTPKGRRDYVLLATMFNTGARVQEILDLKACDLQLTKPFQLQFMGKGRKQRYCPIWPQTARLLRRLCMELNIDLKSEVRIFQNCRGAPLSRFGVRYILNECLKHAQTSTHSFCSKRLHPHSMRHSTAVALLKSGVDLTTISQWLGHSDPKTTNRYATIDLEMKRKAIESVQPVKSQETQPWSRDNTIIEWLESL